jgi:2-succinyl-5-enolpyruvyl-6-hydroxy-3-cyclohexene-1-carboxylate synthase
MFASHPSQTLSLPRPSQDVPARWLVSTIDQALGALHSGGIHINCPFAEPLYGEMDDTGVEWQQQLGAWWQSDKPWLRQSCIWKAKSSATGFSGGKSGAWSSRAA